MTSKKDFSKAYKRGAIFSVYQPIIEIKSRNIWGYEALTRGRQQWRQPEDLFRYSYVSGHTIHLDFACLYSAVKVLSELPSKRLLFVNVEPVTVSQTFIRGREGEAFLRKIRPYSRQVVFELTEGMKARDFKFVRRGVQFLRRAGCRFALDDVAGIGSKLLKLISLNPDFIKIDMGLIKGISTNRLNQKLVRQLIKLAERNDSVTIAEGVEDKADLDFVNAMGIHCAQGFYFARPQKKLLRTLPKKHREERERISFLDPSFQKGHNDRHEFDPIPLHALRPPV